MDVEELPRAVAIKVTFYDADTVTSDVLGSFTVNLAKFAASAAAASAAAASATLGAATGDGTAPHASTTAIGGGPQWYPLVAAAKQSKGVATSGEAQLEVSAAKT